MRISDWSSDVCSSDLQKAGDGRGRRGTERRRAQQGRNPEDGKGPLAHRCDRRGCRDGRGAETLISLFLQAARIQRRIFAGRTPGKSKAVDRKAVGYGKRVSERVDPGGHHKNKKKKQ